jgi:signal peptidase I
MRQARTIASVFAQLVVLVLIGIAFFVRAPQVSGLSMEPRIHSGEFVLINTLAYRLGRPQRGDVIAFQRENPTPETYIKRIVGLPGDRVAVDRGVVVVNGNALAEPYVRFRDERSVAARTVPADAVYVLGDNRADSDDSRDFGPIAIREVIGRAVAVLWPPARLNGRAQ